jgi:hypothetical protein
MLRKAYLLALIGIAVSFSFYAPVLCAANAFKIIPPTSGAALGWDGTDREIVNVLPGDWKETILYTDAYGGTSSNIVQYDEWDTTCEVHMWLDTPLTSGSNTIPLTYKDKPTLQYLLAYVNAYNPATSTSGPGQGSRCPATYQPFSAASSAPGVRLYRCAPSEVSTDFLNPIQLQCQMKYAIAVPDNQPPGTYTGTIKYQVNHDGGVPVIPVRQCNIVVTVGNYFRLSVDRGSVDFEKMNRGQTKDNIPVEGVIVTSKTNTGNPWYLKISNDSPLSNGPFVIPNSNFIWYGYSEGKGKWYGNGLDPIMLTPTLMYASDLTEGNNLPKGTLNHLKFKLSIPRGQAGGKYISTVRLTLTE